MLCNNVPVYLLLQIVTISVHCFNRKKNSPYKQNNSHCCALLWRLCDSDVICKCLHLITYLLGTMKASVEHMVRKVATSYL